MPVNVNALNANKKRGKSRRVILLGPVRLQHCSLDHINVRNARIAYHAMMND